MKWRLMLDSSAFGNRLFIDWLRLRRGDLEILLSPIVVAETALWYLYSGLTASDFEEELGKLGGKVLPINLGDALESASLAYENRRRLPFRHHARDYIIGVQAMKSGSDIITYNKGHFEWVNGVRVLTPEEAVAEWLKSRESG